MAMTNAERQANYRARQKKERVNGAGGYRVNTLIDTNAYYGLHRLAKHYAVTKREMLERLIKASESGLTNAMASQEQNLYYSIDID